MPFFIFYANWSIKFICFYVIGSVYEVRLRCLYWLQQLACNWVENRATMIIVASFLAPIRSLKNLTVPIGPSFPYSNRFPAWLEKKLVSTFPINPNNQNGLYFIVSWLYPRSTYTHFYHYLCLIPHIRHFVDGVALLRCPVFNLGIYFWPQACNFLIYTYPLKLWMRLITPIKPIISWFVYWLYFWAIR